MSSLARNQEVNEESIFPYLKCQNEQGYSLYSPTSNPVRKKSNKRLMPSHFSHLPNPKNIVPYNFQCDQTFYCHVPNLKRNLRFFASINDRTVSNYMIYESRKGDVPTGDSYRDIIRVGYGV